MGAEEFLVSTTNRVNHDDPRSNMYGVLPCPKCRSKYRWPTSPTHPKHPKCIVCDECGFVESTAGR